MNTAWAWVAIGLMVSIGRSGIAQAGRPLMTDDAEPVEPGKFELELAAAYTLHHDQDLYETPMGLTVGVLPRLELGIAFGGQFCDTDTDEDGHTEFERGLSDLTVGGKWKLLDQDRFLADQALSLGAKLPTADDDKGLGSGEVDYDLTWIATRQLNEQWVALVNVGYTWVGQDNDVVHYGLAVTWQMTSALQPVAEIVAETPVQGGGATSVGANVGIRWAVNESLVLDGAVGTSLANDWPDLTMTVGLTFAF